MALPFFAVTLFVSAFLLFLVQPMIGKAILPRLGGTPQVWNTCMVFFQMALLAGYAYTHTVSSRLKLRQQLIVHGCLLLAPLLILLPTPFNVLNWIPPPGANPIPATLLLLTTIVGLPFFVVATSAPLLQKWFASTGHPAAKDPYFLYGASNLGSLLALVIYPFLVEPWIRLRAIDPATPNVEYYLSQPWIWTFGYVLLIGMVLGCAAMVWKSPPSVQLAGAGIEPPPAPEMPIPPPESPTSTEAPSSAITSTPSSAPAAAPPLTPPPPPPPVESGIKAAGPGAGPGPRGPGSKSTAFKKGGKHKHHPKPPMRRDTTPSPAATAATAATAAADLKRLDELTPMRRLRWVGLAAVPSSLMLGVTTYITTDLSPIPLFWLIPLTLYLASFILVFMRWPVLWADQPHKVMLAIQPAAIAVLIFFVSFGSSSEYIVLPVLVNVVAFFITALVCHGELAKDRPGTKHLTEFYLWMSVGGMLGGMFNALIAPVLFVYVIEFGIAIFLACLVRPTLKEGGWTDTFVAETFAKPGPGGVKHRKGHAEETESLHWTLDLVLPGIILVIAGVMALGLYSTIAGIFGAGGRGREGGLAWTQAVVFGLPLAVACFYHARPLRFALAVGAVLVIHGLYSMKNDSTIYADRSYFGILRVHESAQAYKYLSQNRTLRFTQLIHGHINHGMNFIQPESEEDIKNPDLNFSRLATTYYHRYGPVGAVMEQYNWFRFEKTVDKDGNETFKMVGAPQNTYWADNRMPASIAAIGGDAMSQLVNLWSEPPYATIGLGTGTMASYSRPYQHMHYYEIDNHVRALSLPPEGSGRRTFFTYVHNAGGDEKKTPDRDPGRGVNLWILMGDARLKMAQPYQMFEFDPAHPERTALMEKNGGPEKFYHMMVVDAFTSDAIPAHLITKEAISMYFDHLAEGGILCVHTSNRFVDLVPVVADVAAELKLFCRRGRDNFGQGEESRDATRENLGHFTSEWVMVARTKKDLNRMEESMPLAAQAQAKAQAARRGEEYWTTPVAGIRNVWTDDYLNLMAVFRPLQTGAR